MSHLNRLFILAHDEEFKRQPQDSPVVCNLWLHENIYLTNTQQLLEYMNLIPISFMLLSFRKHSLLEMLYTQNEKVTYHECLGGGYREDHT